jgi:hypothetical protein
MKSLYSSLLDIPSRHSRSEIMDEGVHLHYCVLIRKTLHQCGVDCESLQIEVRSVDKARDGKPVYVAMIYLARWERESALRLLIGLPLIELRMREAARGSWMSSHSHFVGLWLHASSRLEAPAELRHLVCELTSGPAASGSAHDRRERQELADPSS